MVAEKTASLGFPEEAQERLLVEAAQNDPSKFAGLYEYNFERVYAFIARRVTTREEAEDLTSEVFQKALASLPRFKWRGVSFASWLVRIAGNLLADRYKTSVREGERSSVDDLADLAAPETRAAQENLETIERQAALFRLVRKLPEDQRRVIVMRFAEDKSIREIANELGKSEGAVKQLQFRGVQTLRAGLGETNG